MYEVVVGVGGVWRGCMGGVAPFEYGGFESKVGDESGEIRGGAVRELGGEIMNFACFDGGAIEGVAGGDDDGVGHEGTGNGAEELFWRGLGFSFVGFGLEEDFLPFEFWSGGYWLGFFWSFFG